MLFAFMFLRYMNTVKVKRIKNKEFKDNRKSEKVTEIKSSNRFENKLTMSQISEFDSYFYNRNV